ncbi:IclR family transcriptional regulator C-terminal domain-containing protein [Aurantibacter sp.]|uniref:IclR family transcriptional regulator n=1 Tax=Aurantibacter sp. TaxID=2807103 RepID=UPI00326664BD
MIQVIHRALDIFELLLNNDNKGMPLREIADELRLNHSTCSNILKTLADRKYLEKSSVNRYYKIGPMLISAMSDNSQSYRLIKASEEPMKELSKATNENCTIGILKDGIRFSLHQVLVEHDLNVISKREKPVYDTSTGRVILAYLSREDQMNFIQAYGLPDDRVWPEVKDEQSLLSELDVIKKNKIAIQISVSHVMGLAVPIIVDEIGLIASLGVYLPEVRLFGAKKKLIIKELFAAQSRIHQNLNEG